MNEYRQYLLLKNYKPSTIKNALTNAKEYESYLNKTENPKTYWRYLQERKNKNNPGKTLSKTTINNKIYTLRLYEKYFLETQNTLKSFYFIKPFRKETKAIEILSVRDMRALFENAGNSRNTAVLACLYYLGLRASEAAGLLLEDVDLEENLILIRTSKTKKQRQVPIHPKAQELFKIYLEERTNNPSESSKGNHFLQGLKGNLTSDGIARIITRIAEKSPLEKKIYPHLLRHSIATHLLKNGMELQQVSQFLGHSRLESTERYTHY
jgi:site-specific recombinase XerD